MKRLVIVPRVGNKKERSYVVLEAVGPKDIWKETKKNEKTENWTSAGGLLETWQLFSPFLVE